MDAAKGGVARQTNTDNMGRFQAIDIEPGSYVIGVEKTGFKKSELTVTLDVNTKLDVGNDFHERREPLTDERVRFRRSHSHGHHQHHGQVVRGGQNGNRRNCP